MATVVWMTASYRQSHSLSQLALSEGRATIYCRVCIHQKNWVNSHNGHAMKGTSSILTRYCTTVIITTLSKL